MMNVRLNQQSLLHPYNPASLVFFRHQTARFKMPSPHDTLDVDFPTEYMTPTNSRELHRLEDAVLDFDIQQSNFALREDIPPDGGYG